MFLVHFSGTIKLIQPQISIAASLKWLVQSIKTLKIVFKSKIKQTEIITIQRSWYSQFTLIILPLLLQLNSALVDDWYILRKMCSWLFRDRHFS